MYIAFLLMLFYIYYLLYTSISYILYLNLWQYSFLPLSIKYIILQCQYSLIYFRDIVLGVSVSLKLVLYWRTIEKEISLAPKMNQHYLLQKMQTNRLSRFYVRQSYANVFFPRDERWNDAEEHFVIIVGREIAVHCIWMHVSGFIIAEFVGIKGQK